jgi:hypothetical protein
VEFSASHRFDRPLDQVSAAFLDPDAHVGRYDLSGARDIEIEHVESGADVLDLTTVRTVEGEVPAIAQKLVKATNTITTTERWERGAGGCTGQSTMEASNVPGTATMEATIEAAGDSACVYTIVLTLAMKVPLIGDRFVKLLRPQVIEILDAEFEAWDRWFARSDVA